VLGWVYAGSPDFSPPTPAEAFQGCPSGISEGCRACLFAANDQIASRGIMTVISIGLLGVATFTPIISANKAFFWRESSWLPQPQATAAWLLGKDVSYIPQLVSGPALYIVSLASLTTPRSPLGRLFAVAAAVYYAASGLGYFVAAAAPPAMAQLAGVIIVFGLASFAGAEPTLVQLASRPPPLRWIPHVSFLRYSLEALYVSEAIEYVAVAERQGVNLPQHVRETLGFDVTEATLWRDVAITCAFGIAFRLLSIVVLVLKDREKKR
jgi:hypothetical protein